MIMVLVLKTYRYPVALITPKLLHELVLQFLLPFSCQESFDSVSALKKLTTIAPLRIYTVQMFWKGRSAMSACN